jgi:hypothetical protein
LEVIFNQLVFLHALRTRVNTASTNVDTKKKTKKESQMTARDPSVAAPNIAITSAKPSSNSNSSSNASSPGSSTIVAYGASSVSSSNAKKANGEAATPKQASIQAGSISNLVTVDAANLNSFLELTAGKTPVNRFKNFSLTAGYSNGCD